MAGSYPVYPICSHDLAVAETAPVAELAPGDESTTVAELAVAEKATVAENAPDAEELAPVAELAPGDESTTVAELAQGAESTPDAENAPGAETAMIAETAAAEESTPVAEKATVAENAPDAETAIGAGEHPGSLDQHVHPCAIRDADYPVIPSQSFQIIEGADMMIIYCHFCSHFFVFCLLSRARMGRDYKKWGHPSHLAVYHVLGVPTFN